MQAYSDPTREADPYALPDVEVFEMTAHEVAAMDEDLVWEYAKRHEFRLAHMNSQVRQQMLDAIVEEQQLMGGWFWWSCFPGCLPESAPMGPFATRMDALADAQEDAQEEETQ